MTVDLPTPKRTTEIDRVIGERIKIMRKSKKLSQTALSEAVGVTFQQFQKYENGTNRIAAGRLQIIAKVLGVSLATLYGGDDEMEPGTDPLEFLGVTGAVELLRAYAEIENEELRRNALAIVQSATRINLKSGSGSA